MMKIKISFPGDRMNPVVCKLHSDHFVLIMDNKFFILLVRRLAGFRSTFEIRFFNDV